MHGSQGQTERAAGLREEEIIYVLEKSLPAKL
jgi:hypothetical protein